MEISGQKDINEGLEATIFPTDDCRQNYVSPAERETELLDPAISEAKVQEPTNFSLSF